MRLNKKKIWNMPKIISLILFIIIALPMSAKNTFENPDFSYPEDVMVSADSVLASRKATDLDRVSAITQYARAMTMRDADSLAVVLRRLDNVMAQVTAHDARALLFMYKASILSAAYQFFEYKIEGNELPLDSLPDNPELWSTHLRKWKACNAIHSIVIQLSSSGIPIMRPMTALS